MKTLFIALFTLVVAVAHVSAQPLTKTAPEIKPRAWLADVSVEPYGTVAWTGLDGKAVLGAGANVVTHIGRGFSIWGFGESDSTGHSVVDRVGIGPRYEGNLGKRVKGDAGVAGCYDLEHTTVFLRLETGLNVYVIQTKQFDLAGRVAYAFDIDGDGKKGSAAGRAFIGPVFTLKF